MKKDNVALFLKYTLFTLALGATLTLLFFAWLGQDSPVPQTKEQRLALKHNRKPASERLGNMEGVLAPGKGKPSALPGDWPQLRGPARDNIGQSKIALKTNWPAGTTPPVLWRVSMGEGHAGATIHNGCVYVVDYDRARQMDAIRCLSLDDGTEIWRYSYPVEIKRNHGMSRTVPVVTDDYVVSIGPLCHVHCLDAKTGKVIWKKDMTKEYATEVPPWYAGQCPILDGKNLLLAPGGKPLLLSLDLATGNEVWRTAPDLDGMGMTHTSITIAEIGGVRQLVYCTKQGVVGLAAADGKLLWKDPAWKNGIANVPTPVWLGDDRIYFSCGYGTGGMMLKVSPDGSGFKVDELYRKKPEEFGSDQQTPIFYKGYLYDVLPKPSELACMAPDGKRMWASGESRFGLGPYMIVNDLLLAVNDETGELTIAKADPAAYQELAKMPLLKGHDAWAPMAFAEGRLILRDLTEMICVDLGGNKTK
ncbi:TPA: polyvinylalcohol dehydrogenase [Candidatus Sumerlaeota bacterium]|nr:polyvinylalcohol dehydrogenase [Candidatus Sumerlaeota bacterium]